MQDPATNQEFDQFLNMGTIDIFNRPAMNQDQYDAEYGSINRPKIISTTSKIKSQLKTSYVTPFTGCNPFFRTLVGFMPILEWLPKYNFREDFLSDVIGGLTTGIMHVPQGIAYSVLAGVDPVYGLYASCFPAFFYMFFGGSRHASIGSFAVIALMAGVANDNVFAKHSGQHMDSNGTMVDDVTPIQIAATLTFTLGMWQFLCGVLRLQFLITYFSDPLVSGFTTGAAVHVLFAQIDDIMGVVVPKKSGPGYLFGRMYDLIINIPNVNYAALIISFCSMAFLYVGKEFLSPLLVKKCKFTLPIPYELIVVAISAAASSIFNWDTSYEVLTVGNIPAGLPQPNLPTWNILLDCLLQSAGIAIVTIAIHMSMAQLLAKKLGYKIDTNQEFYALGMTGMLGGLFPVYPICTALGRTMVNVNSGTKTQFSTIFSCSLLLAIILWLGPLLRDLPKCVLASIITIALQSLFKKGDDLKNLYTISKTDLMIWIVSFLSTMCIDVMEGLAISILFAICTIVFRSQWPKWQMYLHCAPEQNSSNESSVDLTVFRFEGPLLFTNSERFKSSIRKTLNAWMQTWPEHPELGEKSGKPEESTGSQVPKFLIVDCTAITALDYMGVTALREMIKEVREGGISIYFSGTNESVRTVMVNSKLNQLIHSENLFPTLKDAVIIARRNANAVRMLNSGKQIKITQCESEQRDLDDLKSPTFNLNAPASPIIRLSASSFDEEQKH